MVTVDVAGCTDTGLVRRRNEDCLYVGRSLYAVADGLGGHTAGDIASATVIDVVQTHDRQVPPTDLPTVLGRAVWEANNALRHKIAAEPALAGMATTLVAMLWSETTAVIANVGDSRAYLLRGNGGYRQDRPSALTQITEDHTYGHLVADAPDVPDLPARLARFLDGRADGRSPDLTRRDIRSGDRFLLCSDGLTAVVPHRLIHDAVSERATPSEAADRLVTLATDHGGPDNITVIVIDIRAA